MKRNGMAWLLALLATPAMACGDLTVSDAWVRAAPPTAQVMAGYLTLANDGDEEVTVEGAVSPTFERVELHSMTHVDGVMRMRRVERIEIAPGEQVELAPGGLHLMLIGPTRSYAIGEQVEIELLLCKEQRQSLRLPVREG